METMRGSKSDVTLIRKNETKVGNYRTVREIYMLLFDGYSSGN